jgi:hypothetical protein
VKKTFIAWLYNRLSSEEQKEITDRMLKAYYPNHHLRHKPMKREKDNESIRSGVSVAQEAGPDAVALPLTEAQVPGEAV